MAEWFQDQPEVPKHLQMRIVRTPAAEPLTGFITSAQPIGIYTHFSHKRTTPCEGADKCPLCLRGNHYRWHSYLSVFFTHGLGHQLFELTGVGIQYFDDWRASHNTLRGLAFRAYRPSHTGTGRVVILIGKLHEHPDELPPAPNVRNLLCRIWGIEDTATAVRTNPDSGRTQIVPVRDAITHKWNTAGDGKATAAS